MVQVPAELRATRSLVALRVHAPLAVMVTGNPELAVAVGVYVPPTVAFCGAELVTVMLCRAGLLVIGLPLRVGHGEGVVTRLGVGEGAESDPGEGDDPTGLLPGAAVPSGDGDGQSGAGGRGGGEAVADGLVHRRRGW